MRRSLFKAPALLLALSGLALAAWVAPYTYKYEMTSCPAGYNAGLCISPQSCSAGTCNGTAPTLQGEGMVLTGAASYRLRTCAENTALSDGGTTVQTLSGAGTLQAYWYDPAEALWIRNAGLDVSVNGSGQHCQVWQDFIVTAAQRGRIRYVASGVTVSGGSTLDVLLDGYSPEN